MNTPSNPYEPPPPQEGLPTDSRRVAICPQCRAAVPRFGILIDPVSCPGCSQRLIQNRRWRLVGNLIWALSYFILFGALLALLQGQVMMAAMIAAVLWLLLGWWAFPYVSKYDVLTTDTDEQPGQKLGVVGDEEW